MPWSIKKIKGGYRVRSKSGIRAIKTTMAKAKRQVRLLKAIDHGWHPMSHIKKTNMRMH